MPKHNESPLSFAALQNRLVVTGELVALTALRIGAGRAVDFEGTDLPVLRDALQRPFIPGASLKGALRARMEALIRAVANDQDASAFEQQLNSIVEEVQAEEEAISAERLKDLRNTVRSPDAPLDFDQIERRTKAIGALKAKTSNVGDSDLSELIWHLSSDIDLIFGSPQIAGRIFFKDAQVDEKLWFGQHEIRNGVALNRDTETVEEKLLYNYEVTPAGTRFDFELVMENAEPWQLGIVLLALKPWERGEAAIGGFRSRGLGRFRIENARRRYTMIDGVDALLDLLMPGYGGAGREVTADDERMWIGEFRRRLSRRTA